MTESAALLVDEVFPAQPVRQWVLSFPYPLRFLFASRPAIMGQVLGIVYRCIATHLIKKAGFSCTTARTGAVTLIQRFGSALNLNIHFHMLFVDGVYVDGANGSSTRFRWVKAPTSAELTQLTHTIARRVGRFLERQGLLERDAENSYLSGDGVEGGRLDQLLGHSITYRIAVGPHAGRKVFTLQTLPDCNEPFDNQVGKMAGFSLHAGVAARADERKKLERLCRTIARPAVSEKRLSLTGNGNVRYELKTPYRDGTTHVIFEPLDFIARLVALVAKPRVNLTRFHGVFAPNSAHRARVTPAKRGKGNKASASHAPEDPTPAERRAAMAGFCSCKTGIHAIHGNNLGAALEACVQHRHRDLQELRRHRQDHRLHRRSAGHQQDSHPPGAQRCLRRRPAITTVSGAAPGQLVRLIRINHASSRCDIEGIAGSLSSRAWKPSKNRAEVQNFCRLRGAIQANTASKRRLTTV